MNEYNDLNIANSIDWNNGFSVGYKKAYEEIQRFIYSKDINPIDQMYARSATIYDHIEMQGATGATGPIGYMP